MPDRTVAGHLLKHGVTDRALEEAGDEIRPDIEDSCPILCHLVHRF